MTPKLRYIGRMTGFDYAGDTRLWDVLEPALPGFERAVGYPSMGIEGLKEWGIVK